LAEEIELLQQTSEISLLFTYCNGQRQTVSDIVLLGWREPIKYDLRIYETRLSTRLCIIWGKTVPRPRPFINFC